MCVCVAPDAVVQLCSCDDMIVICASAVTSDVVFISKCGLGLYLE